MNAMCGKRFLGPWGMSVQHFPFFSSERRMDSAFLFQKANHPLLQPTTSRFFLEPRTGQELAPTPPPPFWRTRTRPTPLFPPSYAMRAVNSFPLFIGGLVTSWFSSFFLLLREMSSETNFLPNFSTINLNAGPAASPFFLSFSGEWVI